MHTELLVALISFVPKNRELCTRVVGVIFYAQHSVSLASSVLSCGAWFGDVSSFFRYRKGDFGGYGGSATTTVDAWVAGRSSL